jgi:hypothetical protein
MDNSKEVKYKYLEKMLKDESLGPRWRASMLDVKRRQEAQTASLFKSLYKATKTRKQQGPIP